MSFNVKIIYPEKLIFIGNLVKINPLYLSEELAFKMKIDPLEWPMGVVLKINRTKNEKWYQVGFPEGTCSVDGQAIILC